ncbi:hypothetical protein H6F44_04095 [Pseudanabaena sp. FACHB-1277]|jgi:hypothetical protein|uniref:Uncharacterized protein n=1 Tax=Pseudanabaena cinerea FACHB-1277 TaxID=2949581 RepID=A0A926US45_9CYAN|nr:hypothetical protein [Pseudanabaena cinerea]MBD2149307.1 hypothetical protein [Pseudanabaena cinerea FACHB-1277]
MKFLKQSMAAVILGSLSLLATSAIIGATSAQEKLKPIAPRFAPDPQLYSGVAGGDTPVQDLAGGQANGKCQGFTRFSPSHALTVQRNFGFLSLQVSSDRNLSLLVKGPDGTYCRNGKSPELSGAWVSGKYEIWVGTDDGESVNYRLSISETSQ